MVKFVYAIMLIVMVELSLFLFAGPEYTTTSLFNMIYNPQSILNNPLYQDILDALAVFSIAIIVAGTFFNINIYAIYAGVTATTITFVSVLINAFVFLQPAIAAHAGSSMATTILIVTLSPLIIFYLIASIEWVRSNQ